MSLTPQALRLLSREVVTLRSDPPEGVRIVVDEEDLTCIEGWVQGPTETPYEGGYFRIRFNFTAEYPNVPPKCTMMTKIFHPNVSKSGEICVDTLKKGWKKEYGIGHVLVTIKCLLIYPNPESALDEESGKQLLADYDGYCKYARLMTSIHATPRAPPPEFRQLSTSSTTTTTTRPTVSSRNHSTTSLVSEKVPSSSKTTPSPASTSTLTLGKPLPLGQHNQQEQSPVVSLDPENNGKLENPPLLNEEKVDKILKPINVPASSAKTGVKKPVAGGTAKRGLKRL